MSIFQNCLYYPRFCKTNIAWYGRKILRTYSFRSAYFLPYSSKLFSSSSNMFINMHSKLFFKKQQLFFWSRKYAFSYRKSKSFTSVRYIASEIIKESSIPKTSEVMRIFRLAAPEKKKLMVGIGLLLISSGITMAVPYCLGRIIDIIYTAPAENMMETLTSFCQVLVVVFLLGSIANFGRVHIMQTSGQRIIQKMRKGVFSSIMNQEIEFFDKNKTGELINRLSADTALVGQALTNNLSDGLRSLSAVVAGVSMMFYVSPKLALFALGIVPPFAVIAVVCGRYVKSISRNIQDTLASSTQIAEERISNIRTVRAFAQENKEMQVYEQKVKDVLLLTYKEAIIKGFFFGAAGLCGNLIVLSVLYYGGVMMTNSQITVGDLSSFLMYAAYVGISVGGLTSVYSEIMRGMGASTRLWQLIDRIPKIPLTDGVTPSSEIRGIIEFRDVSFSYPTRKDAFIFNSLNLVVPAASVMAVVGASGSGKSTLAALFLRFYNPDAGKILLDGYDITNLNPAWLRHNIGTVSQEPILFSCSIADNIVYGASDSSSIRTQHLIDVAKKANAFNFINSFPDKFNTLVGERGVMLSGGQKQRIAIARALLKNPKILLLDEATSALDAESEFLVQEALERLMEGRTVLTIAHRLSTIKNADQIAVLHNGKFAELGSYEELMKLPNGLFKKLVERQTIITQ